MDAQRSGRTGKLGEAGMHFSLRAAAWAPLDGQRVQIDGAIKDTDNQYQLDDIGEADGACYQVGAPDGNGLPLRCGNGASSSSRPPSGFADQDPRMTHSCADAGTVPAASRLGLVLVRRPTPPRLWLLYGLAVVLTFGVLLPILAVLWALAWWLDDAPVAFDDEGLTTRRGRRVLWREVTASSVQAEHLRRGSRLVRVRWYVRLETGSRRLHFQPDLYTNGAAGLAWLERALGTTLLPPA